MENATKALIIAGDVIISLAVIGLAVYFLNGTSSTIKKANLNSEEAQAHNSKFDAYFGNNVTATEVKSLLKAITSNNITAKTSDDYAEIAVDFEGTNASNTVVKSSSVSEITKNIRTGVTYVVEIENEEVNDEAPSSDSKKAGYYTNGFIKRIKITQNAKK